MRIGIFTDSYYPAINGITYVIDIMRRNFEAQGHEVIIFAPETRIRRLLRRREPHIVRFAAIEGVFFDGQQTSFFLPPMRLQQIAKLELDIIYCFTPAQIGMMGVYTSVSLGIPVVMQYSTDLIEYISRYPAVVPGVVGLVLSAPFLLKMRPKEAMQITARLRRERDYSLSRGQDLAKKMLTVVHNHCDAIVAVSPKSAAELSSWGATSPVVTIPTGVNALPVDAHHAKQLRRHWGAGKDDAVLMYVGRLGAEKNLDLLVEAFALVHAKRPKAKLVFVGDFSHRETLEALVRQLGIDKAVKFTGRIDRARLGGYYAAADIFCFPSLTDTQALVLNEAAHQALPIVWCDKGVNSVLVDKKSGFLAASQPADYAKKLLTLIDDPTCRKRLGSAAQGLARQTTEEKQTAKILELFNEVISRCSSGDSPKHN